MIVVHHLEESRSQRVLWLLEELSLPYEVKRYNRDPQTRLAPPELKAVHPLGKSPVVQFDGRVLAESGAIIEYFAENESFGALSVQPGHEKRAEYLHWLHFAEGSAMLPILLMLYVFRLGEAGAPLHPRIQSEIANHLGYADAALANGDYFVDNRFTAADIQMSFVVEASAARGGLDKGRPRLMDWLARIHARPAYQRALERGGPYELLR